MINLLVHCIMASNKENKFSVCCLCFEHRGVNSKKFSPVGSNIIQKIRLYIKDSYDPNMAIYSEVPNLFDM